MQQQHVCECGKAFSDKSSLHRHQVGREQPKFQSPCVARQKILELQNKLAFTRHLLTQYELRFANVQRASDVTNGNAIQCVAFNSLGGEDSSHMSDEEFETILQTPETAATRYRAALERNPENRNIRRALLTFMGQESMEIQFRIVGYHSEKPTWRTANSIHGLAQLLQKHIARKLGEQSASFSYVSEYARWRERMGASQADKTERSRLVEHIRTLPIQRVT